MDYDDVASRHQLDGGCRTGCPASAGLPTGTPGWEDAKNAHLYSSPGKLIERAGFLLVPAAAYVGRVKENVQEKTDRQGVGMEKGGWEWSAGGDNRGAEKEKAQS